MANTWITKRTGKGVCRRQVKVGLQFYVFFYLFIISCFGKYATSVSGARLTALVARMVHACTR